MVFTSQESVPKSDYTVKRKYYKAGHGDIIQHFQQISTPQKIQIIDQNKEQIEETKTHLQLRAESLAHWRDKTLADLALLSPPTNRKKKARMQKLQFHTTEQEDYRPLASFNSSHMTKNIYDLENVQAKRSQKEKKFENIPSVHISMNSLRMQDNNQSLENNFTLPPLPESPMNTSGYIEKGNNVSIDMQETLLSSTQSSSSILEPSYSTLPLNLSSMELKNLSKEYLEEFLIRDREGREQENILKNDDTKKYFLYKKRYMDAYGVTVQLNKDLYLLQQLYHEKIHQMEQLTTEVVAQRQYISKLEGKDAAFNSPNILQSSPIEMSGNYHVLESLRRQLAESEEKIRILEKKTAACQTGKCNSIHNQNQNLQTQLDIALKEKSNLEHQVLIMSNKVKEYEHVSTSAVETLEKMSMNYKDQRSPEAENLREQNKTLKESLSTATENYQKLRKLLDEKALLVSIEKEKNQNLECKLNDLQKETSEITEENKKTTENLQIELTASQEDCDILFSENRSLKEKIMKVEQNYSLVREHNQSLLEQVASADIIRRKLHNKVMDLKGNIRVFCRVRPVLPHERSEFNHNIFSFPDLGQARRQIELHANPNSHFGYKNSLKETMQKKYPFEFDMVWDMSATQDDIFIEISALIQSALDGYNVCIFAYGQTGSGKTFTMQGVPSQESTINHEESLDMGIVGRATGHIFASIEDLTKSGWEYSTSLEVCEIYNENIRDLLAPANLGEKVDLRLDSHGNPQIINSYTHDIKNEAQAHQLLDQARKRRATKATNLNDRSSRSHLIISFWLTGKRVLNGQLENRNSVVRLVDLAGSERLSKSGCSEDKELLKETQSINKSLSALGNVICAIAKKSSHVPYRDSKLTYLLRSSLAGDSKTLMICNLSPLSDHRNESLNTLRFAKQVNSCEIAYPSYASR